MTHRLRSHDLDWLRLLAIMLLIPFHSAAVFYEGELGSFYVVNAERSVGLSLFVQFVHQWHRPLFFFWPVPPVAIPCRHALKGSTYGNG